MAVQLQTRTAVDGKSPVAGSLQPGQLAVEMGTPTRLWVGVPVAQDPTQQKKLYDSATELSAPVGPGAWGLLETTAWTSVLPLTGGTLTGDLLFAIGAKIGSANAAAGSNTSAAPIIIQPGSSDGTRGGSDVRVTGGAPGAGSAVSGSVFLDGCGSTGPMAPGGVTIRGGDGTTSPAGAVAIFGGNSATGGDVRITSGNGVGGASGNISLTIGPTGTGRGNLYLGNLPLAAPGQATAIWNNNGALNIGAGAPAIDLSGYLPLTGGTMGATALIDAVAVPTAVGHLTNKQYVDNLLAQLTGVVIFAGTYDATTSTGTYNGQGGITAGSGALPAPAAANGGAYVIVTVAGPGGAAGEPAGPLAVGDWILSDSTAWNRLAFNQNMSAYLPLSGGTVTGATTFTAPLLAQGTSAWGNYETNITLGNTTAPTGAGMMFTDSGPTAFGIHLENGSLYISHGTPTASVFSPMRLTTTGIQLNSPVTFQGALTDKVDFRGGWIEMMTLPVVAQAGNRIWNNAGVLNIGAGAVGSLADYLPLTGGVMTGSITLATAANIVGQPVTANFENVIISGGPVPPGTDFIGGGVEIRGEAADPVAGWTGGGVVLRAGKSGGNLTGGSGGGTVQIYGGECITAGNGGEIYISAGRNTVSGNGGRVRIRSGDSTAAGAGDISLELANGVTPGALVMLGLPTVAQANASGVWNNAGVLNIGAGGTAGDFVSKTGDTMSGPLTINAALTVAPMPSAAAGAGTSIRGGNTTGAGMSGGNVTLTGGNSNIDGAGGAVSITSGNSAGTGNAGPITITAGKAAGTEGVGGSINLYAGAGGPTAFAASAGGRVRIMSGDSALNYAGPIELLPGSGASGTIKGDIVLGPAGNLYLRALPLTAPAVNDAVYNNGGFMCIGPVAPIVDGGVY